MSTLTCSLQVLSKENWSFLVFICNSPFFRFPIADVLENTIRNIPRTVPSVLANQRCSSDVLAFLDAIGILIPSIFIYYRREIYNFYLSGGKGKVHPRTGHEGPEGA